MELAHQVSVLFKHSLKKHFGLENVNIWVSTPSMKRQKD